MCAHPHTQPEALFPSKRTRHLSRLLLGLTLALAALLRFYHIGTSSLWSDEGNTWALLARSFVQIARDAAADIHPPGYYWLLKVWSLFFGTSAVAMRSFSALLGVLLVYLIYCIGRYFRPQAPQLKSSWPALAAALLATLNPFQIYYSQEARMYLLLTVAGAGLMLALIAYLHSQVESRNARVSLLGYIASGSLGLWTHYSFPIVLAAAGLGYLAELRRAVPLTQRWRSLRAFGVANIIVLLIYLPWLPTAVRRLLAWPAGGEATTLRAALQLTITTLLVGPRQHLPEPQLLWMAMALLLPLIGLVAARRNRGSYLLFLWWALPIGLMFGVGLFSDAFLKFLLTASPPWLLLIVMASWQLPWPRLGIATIALGSVALAVTILPSYYTDPTVRDNYAGVAAYIAATADPQQDLVLLNAPGQQEVWHYYDPGIPILALPQQRPADPQATIAALANATANRRNIYTLFWATDEADPDHIVEEWLDQHAFKGLERWQGNLRFVIYSLSTDMQCDASTSTGELPEELSQRILWGDSIALRALCRPQNQQMIVPGEAILLSLHWQATAEIPARYKVSVQLLNEQNLVIEQHDSEPVGGSRPTDTWQPNELIVDNHGILPPIGTPPGSYRMIVAVYDRDTGARLQITSEGAQKGNDYLEAGIAQVVRPEQPLPAALVPVQYRIDRPLGPLQFVGYSVHRQGFAHEPLTPILPGDPIEFTFVWQAPSPLPQNWPATIPVTLTLGNEQSRFAAAGDDYPTAQWYAGQLLQHTVLLHYDGTTTRPRLQIGEAEIWLQAILIK